MPPLQEHSQPPTRDRVVLSLSAGACLVMAVAVSVSIVFYNRANDIDYSPFSHLFSELGWAKHSPAAGFFNFCLCLASIMNAPLFWLLGQRIGLYPGRMAAVAGIAATWACYGVGLIPLGPSPLYLPYQGGRVGLHFLVSIIFFWTWIVTMVLWLFALWQSPAGRRMLPLIGACLLALAAALTFLAVPNERILTQLARGTLKTRGDFYWTPTLEWCVIGTIGLWLLAAIHALWTQRPPSEPRPEPART